MLCTILLNISLCMKYVSSDYQHIILIMYVYVFCHDALFVILRLDAHLNKGQIDSRLKRQTKGAMSMQTFDYEGSTK